MKVIVVGGGTSGLMASVSAALAGAEVILLDKNPSLGRKLLLTGGTRCNVTNIRSRDEIIKHIPGNGRFLHSAFSQFDNQDIIEFFQKRGVQLKEVDPKTLESKITQGVYFCGELLDIHGYTGGYNITAAFVTGYVAGLHAAQGW